MFIVGQLFWAVGQLLDMLLTVYMWMFIISALLSWVNPDPYNPIVRFLRRATEPVLFRLRQRFPLLWSGGVDFSPMLVIVLIYFVKLFVVGSLLQAATIIRLQGV